MKSRIKKKYIEVPFQVFIDECPEALELFPVELRTTLINDPDYIIRLSDDGDFEVGYKSDKWTIA